MTRPKTAREIAAPRDGSGRFAPKGMRASLMNVDHRLVEPDPLTPIYNAVLADLTKPRKAKR